jgi:hypothetical protein
MVFGVGYTVPMSIVRRDMHSSGVWSVFFFFLRDGDADASCFENGRKDRGVEKGVEWNTLIFL